jgi:hypothetical protein
MLPISITWQLRREDSTRREGSGRTSDVGHSLLTQDSLRRGHDRKPLKADTI